MIKGKDEMSQCVRFNYDLLTQCIERDRATVDEKLYNKDTKLNRESVINGVCNCGNEFSKKFRYVYEKGGMFCKECIEKERGVSYDIKLLRECSERDEAKLDVSIYNDTIKLNRESSINFICQCNTSCTKIFRYIYKKGGMFCEQCTMKNSIQKFKKSCLDHYGFEHPLQVEEFKEKNKQTNLKNRGVENPMQDPEVREKSKQTCLDRYGFEHPFQVEEFKEKSKQTCLDRYGFEHPFQVEEFKEKYKQTFLDRYEAEHPLQVKEFKEKSKQTCLDRYKCEHPMQNADVAENAFKNAHNLKEYTMPSGKIRKLQGYEIFGMNILLKTYQENDIVTCRTEVPELWYSFEEKDTRHRHYVDFYIPSVHKCIEVKSMWTYDQDEDKVLAKQASAKKDGFSYEIWIFDKKETLVKKIV